MMKFAMTGLALTLTLAAGQARAQTPAEWEQVIANAKKEGTVTVYSGYISPLTHNAIAAAFEKKYGIKIDYWTARGVELRERARIETTTNRHIGDVMHNAISNMEMAFGTDKSVDALPPVPNASRVKEAFKFRVTNYQVPIFTINYGFLVNTSLVKPADEPKSWADLADPKWKGKILSDDPRTSGGGAVMFRMLFPTFGDEYLKKLAANNITFARDYQESSRRVARGEFAMYIPYILSDYPNLKGLPVKYVIPSEGATYGSYSASILKGAPHPNAARLLVDFYLSDEAQQVYASTGHGVMVEAASKDLAPDLKALANVRPLAQENFPMIDKMYEEAQRIFGKP